MSMEISAKRFVEELKSHRSPDELKKIQRYFKSDKGQYGEGDKFIGVRMGQVFALAKEFIEMPPSEIEKLLESPIHEVRAGGCSIMGKQATRKKTPASRRKELYDLYLRRHDRINNWDLVDLGAYKVVGSYLFDFDKPRNVLYKLARSKDTWERRTARLNQHRPQKGAMAQFTSHRLERTLVPPPSATSPLSKRNVLRVLDVSPFMEANI